MVPLRGRRATDLLGDYTGEPLGGFARAARPIGYAAAPTWRPETDLYETADAYHAVLDLAGVDREGISAEVEGGLLTVRGVQMDGSRAGRRRVPVG
jgi:HSP20 family molecular chaperone IbpA